MKCFSYVLIAIFTFVLSALSITFFAGADSNVMPSASYSTTDDYPKTDGRGEYVLLPDNMYSSATIQFFSKPAGIDTIISITFEYMTCDDDGAGDKRSRADGIAVVLGQDPSIYSDSKIAGYGGGGRGVITESGGNGISIHFNIHITETIDVRDNAGNIKAGCPVSTYTGCNWSTVNISILGDELMVAKDGNMVLTATLSQDEANAISEYQLGFSAATGDADSAHKIRNIQVGGFTLKQFMPPMLLQ